MNADRLKSIPLFSSLSKKQLAGLASLMDEVDVPEGKHLVDQGSFAYEFVVVEQGTCDVLRGDEVIATLGPGDFFGEIGLLEADRRTATVVARTPMRLIVTAVREFRQMLRDMPQVAAQIESAAKERLAKG